MEALARAQAAGKILHIGVSNFTAWQIRRAHSLLPLSCVQIQYNLLDRTPESEILPCCRELGLGVLVYGPLAQGLLTGKYGARDRFQSTDRRSRLKHFQSPARESHLAVVERLNEASWRLGGKTPVQIALRWLLDQPEVTSVITGVKNSRQIEDNAGAADWLLHPAAHIHT